MRLKKYEPIKSHLNYIIALCFYGTEKIKMAAKHFDISIKDGIPFNSFYYIAIDILEKNLDSFENCIAYVKLLKRQKITNPECIEIRIRLAQFYAKINDFKNAINVNI